MFRPKKIHRELLAHALTWLDKVSWSCHAIQNAARNRGWAEYQTTLLCDWWCSRLCKARQAADLGDGFLDIPLCGLCKSDYQRLKLLRQELLQAASEGATIKRLAEIINKHESEVH